MPAVTPPKFTPSGPERTEQAPGALVAFSLWLGLTYGLLEAVILQGLVEFANLPMWRNAVNARILWVGPLVNGAIFGIAGALLAAIVRLVPSRIRSWAWVASLTVLIGTAGIGLAMTSRAITRWAVVAIVTGVFIRGLVWSWRRTELGFARRTLPRVAAAVLIAGLAGEAYMWQQERSALAALPPGDANKPNVLLLILDATRADHFSGYGYPRATTPHMDEIAQQGALFEHAYSTSHWTHPGHTAILTGKIGRVPPHSRRAGGQPPKSLAEILAQQGYATYASSANSMWFTPKAGLGRGVARFNVYFDTLGDAVGRAYFGKALLVIFRDQGGWFDSPWRKRPPRSHQQLLDWVEKSWQLSRPFFAAINYMETHDPYWPPEPFTHHFNSGITRRGLAALHEGTFVRSNLTESQNQMVVDAYDSSLAYLDDEMGKLFAELNRRGLLENTLLLITADHGEALGEEGQHGHVTPILRQEVSRVPLIVRFPGRVPAGLRMSQPVSVNQIPATVASLLGLGAAEGLPAALSFDPATPTSGALIVGSGRAAVADGKWFLLENSRNGRHFLYDMHSDPAQKNNLADDPQFADAKGMMLGRLAELKKRYFPKATREEEAPPQQ